MSCEFPSLIKPSTPSISSNYEKGAEENVKTRKTDLILLLIFIIIIKINEVRILYNFIRASMHLLFRSRQPYNNAFSFQAKGS